jgi:hypothetical protein
MLHFLTVIVIFILALPFALKAWWDCGGLGNTLERHARKNRYNYKGEWPYNGGKRIMK